MPIKVVSLTVALSGELLDRVFCFLQKAPDEQFSIDEVVETAIKYYLELPDIQARNLSRQYRERNVNHG
jgi:hypothetical protein